MLTTQDCPLCSHPSVELRYIEKRPNRYGFCPTCKGIFSAKDSLLSPAEERSQYEMHDNDINDAGYQKFVTPLVSLVRSRHQKSETGLDFGAGPGPVITKMLTDHGYNMHLYDPFFHPDTSVLASQYDFVICCEVIEHFNHPFQTFSQLKELVALGGTLYCRTTLIPDDIEFSRWHYKNELTHVFFYHRETVAWIASNILTCDYTIIDKNVFYFSC